MWMLCFLMLTWSKNVSCIHRRYEWGASPGIGKYSSRLNVTTPDRSSPSSLCRRISSRYRPTGVEPVARPRTVGRPAELFSRTSRSTIRAAWRGGSAGRVVLGEEPFDDQGGVAGGLAGGREDEGAQARIGDVVRRHRVTAGRAAGRKGRCMVPARRFNRPRLAPI